MSCREKNGIAEKYHTMGKSYQEANQSLWYNGNTEYLKCVTDWAHSGLGTDQSLASLKLWPKSPSADFTLVKNTVFPFIKVS